MAVSYLHSKGIVHNDLKPENILITYQDNSVKLIDFGLSDSDAQYLYRTLGCSPEYASPELLARQNTDSRSDIYSLGLLVRDVLGNRAIRIVACCLNRDPSRRYANVDHLRKALSKRHYPLYFAVAAACVIMIVIVIVQFSKQMDNLRDISSSGIQMQEHLDSAYAIMSKELDAKTTNEVVVVKDAGFQEYKADKDRAIVICDSVCNDIKLVVDKAMSDYLDRIKGVPYCEFVLKEYEALHDDLANYKRTWANVSVDPSINDHLERYFTKIYGDYVKLESINPVLPYFNYSPLPDDEKAFYQSLLDNDEPYRPDEK